MLVKSNTRLRQKYDNNDTYTICRQADTVAVDVVVVIAAAAARQ